MVHTSVMISEPTISQSAIFPSVSAEKILEIKKEIAQINLHRVEHIASGRENVIRIDQSCRYCLAYLSINRVPTSARPEKVGTLNTISVHRTSGTGLLARREENNLERTVDLDGRRGRITVPRSWACRKVKVTLLNEYTL